MPLRNLSKDIQPLYLGVNGDVADQVRGQFLLFVMFVLTGHNESIEEKQIQ